MTNRTMKAGLLAVLVALLVGSPAWSRPPEMDEDLRRDVRDLKEDLARLRRDVELDRREAATQARRLEDRLERITLALEKLSGTGVGSSRASMALSPVRRVAGTIRLDNRLGVEARVTIDGIVYSIAPRSVRLLRDQPTGAFTYDVTADGFGQASYRSSLASNETLTVTVY
jgi:hypothetical protein